MDKTTEKKKGPNLKPAIAIVSFFLLFIPMISLYKQLSITIKCLGEKFQEEGSALKKKFIISAVFYSLISALSIAGGSYLLYGELSAPVKKEFSAFMKAAKTKKRLSSKGRTYLEKANKVKLGAGLLLFAIHSSIFMAIIFNKNSTKTKKLRATLKKTYSSFTDDKIGFISFAGAIVEISGFSATEFCAQDSFWTSINMRVSKDHIAVHPDNRSIVLFKPTFELAKAYMWDLPKKNK